MKLLVVTQAVDTQDPVLGFFHEWLCALSQRFESIEVICLKEGAHALPENVRVHSLGKERGSAGALVYAKRFLVLVWRLRTQYDRVFVHMNQEYVLLAGVFWKAFGKKVFLWRNHYAGSWLTDIAAAFATKVFYTSLSSYTAKYPHAQRMPVGVDTTRFREDGTKRTPRSILFLARMSPAKHPEMFVEALERLTKEGSTFSATFAGGALAKDEAFYQALVARAAVVPGVSVTGSVTHQEAAVLVRTHELFVNASPSGMLDKTLFEAAASGCLPLALSEDWRALVGEKELSFTDTDSLVARLRELLALSEERTQTLRHTLQERVVAPHSLERLMDELERILSA